ncbi:MAG: alpha/beta hydrolase [Kiritimatiellales bacterium]
MNLFPGANTIKIPVRELLWPDGAPFAKGSAPDDQPAITIFRPSARTVSSGAAVIICPGGGYQMLAMNHEGVDIAHWLNLFGVTGIVLEYRMSRGGYQHPVPLLDAQRAIRTVRSRAAELGIDPECIGIMGFSAGGHLASSASTHFDSGDASAADPVDRASCRPDFMILCYPVIAFDEAFTHKGSQKNLLGENASPETIQSMSTEKQVSAATPPAFLFHTDEDTGVPPENSIAFYLALKKHNIPAELHVYRKGSHGRGMAQDIDGTRDWPNRLRTWLNVQGFLR